MPLLDHFNPPLNRTHPWRSFHGAWAAAMARLLNQGVLPAGYYAVPLVDRDGPIEIDVAALREHGAPASESGTDWPQTWVAPAPLLAVTVDLPALDGALVQVFADDGDPRLVAAVELLSPRNKDRPAARQAFAVKCVGNRQAGSLCRRRTTGQKVATGADAVNEARKRLRGAGGARPSRAAGSHPRTEDET
jgi:hypothetical protein